MHAQPAEIAAVLGLAHPDSVTFLDLAVTCEKGLPVESLHHLAQTLAPDHRNFPGSLLSTSTLRRRRRQGTLSAWESDLAVRLAATWLMTFHTFKDAEKARRFLFQEHSLLAGRKPVNLAKMNAAGAQAVDQVLGRLRCGSAA